MVVPYPDTVIVPTGSNQMLLQTDIKTIYLISVKGVNQEVVFRVFALPVETYLCFQDLIVFCCKYHVLLTD